MKYLLLILCFLLSSAIQALSLKPNSPSRHVVQPGDSLWLIANRYLEHPWEWKQLWRTNPKINNPNRLFAGDVLILAYDDNTPYLKVTHNGTIKLSPTLRSFPIEEAVPPVPLTAIQPFLNESLVLDMDVLSFAPYIIAYMGEHMLGGQGDEVYVKGLHPSPVMPRGETIGYSVFRPGPDYIHPVTKQFLGYKATLVGYAELIAGGEPATVVLSSVVQGIKINDKVLINNSPEFDLFFEPETPSVPVRGFIIDMPGDLPYGSTQEAVGQVIVVSLGAMNGLKAGDVLGLFAKPRLVKDPKNNFTPIELPLERLGEAMVFRTFTKTSFALIVRSIRPIYLLDLVANP